MLKLFATIVLLLFMNPLSGQNKEGFFDYEFVKKSLIEYQYEKRTIDQLEAHYNDSLISIVKSNQSWSSSCGGTYDSLEMKKWGKELLNQMNELEAFQKTALDTIQSKRTNLEWSVELLISNAITEFCKENDIRFLSSKANLLYCNTCTDFTTELIDFIN